MENERFTDVESGRIFKSKEGARNECQGELIEDLELKETEDWSGDCLLKCPDKQHKETFPGAESDAGSSSDRIDIGNLTHILHTLKDCIWCMNIFMQERQNFEDAESTPTSCSFKLAKKKKHPYPEDDIQKELKYVDYLLNLSIKIMVSKMGKGNKDCNVKTNGKSPDYPRLKTLIYIGKIHLFSEIIRRYNEKAIQVNAIVKDTGETNSKKTFLNNKNIMNDFFWNINNKVNSINSMLLDSGVEPFTPNLSEGKVFLDRDVDWYTNFIEEINSCTQLLDSLIPKMGDEFNVDPREHESESPLTIPPLTDLRISEEVSENVKSINRKVILTNELSGLTFKNITAGKEMERELESIRHHTNQIKAKMRQTTSTNSMPCMPFLLFRKERWRIEVLESRQEDPLDHISGIAYPIPYDSFKNDTCSTFYGIKKKNLLGISLQTVEFTENPFKSTKRKAGKAVLLLMMIFLYTGDFVSDLMVAREHYTNDHYTYGSLTLLFVFLPLIAETASKLILKVLGKDKEYVALRWKDIFTLNDLKIFKRMVRSTQFAINSIRSHKSVATFYSELNCNRCNKGKKHYQREPVKEDSSHIQAVFLAMQTWNERFILQTKITEVLNESAPQLLLQLSIATRECLEHNDISLQSWASIFFSIVSLSWTMHQAHYNRHYNTGGRVLDNAYGMKARVVEFFGNSLVYSSRVLSICSFTAVHHVWFFAGATVYLLLLYLSLAFISERKIMYKGLHRYKATVFWPLHRMFTIPYRIGLWRMDSVDHFLFYLETAVLALTLPFVLHQRLDFNLACAISGAILLGEVCGIVLMTIFRKYVHPEGYVCTSLM
ncbi:uncharacterized protein LOC124156853 [Ischnura elegans]|uniref:uncharacterized protein LOC124156853 n=1 Tax=Ischnura elegans TaxID=197161 RepID=UPI001ED87E2E|nr:uncharacterized protein LOC124156853 [Ischnura elegans]